MPASETYLHAEYLLRRNSDGRWRLIAKSADAVLERLHILRQSGADLDGLRIEKRYIRQRKRVGENSVHKRYFPRDSDTFTVAEFESAHRERIPA